MSLSGCGGGGGKAEGPVARGVVIAWPARGRALTAPGSALSAEISFQQTGGTAVTFPVDRPASDEASTETYELPSTIGAGNYLMTAHFHAAAGAAGDIVGEASANVTVDKKGEVRKPNGKPLGTIGFVGSIAFVELSQGLTVFYQGETRNLNAIIQSSTSYLTLTPGSFHLEVTSGSDVLRVNQGLNVTAISEGPATLVLEVDGKKSPPLTIVVNGPAITPREINLATNALRFDSSRGKIWTSLTTDSIVDIEPATGNLGALISVGDQPSALGLSDDASTLFVGLNGPHKIRPVDLNTRAPGQAFAVTSINSVAQNALSIAVQPRSNTTIAISSADAASSGCYGPQIYDSGVPRANRLFGGSQLVWTSTDRIVTVTGNMSPSIVFSARVDGTGAVKTGEFNSVTLSTTGSILRRGDHIYTADGTVFDQRSFIVNGRFDLFTQPYPVLASGPVLDVSENRAYFVLVSPMESRLVGYRLDNFRQVLNRVLTDVTGPIPTYLAGDPNLLGWGSHGLAFRTPGHVYFIDDTTAL